MWTTEVLVAARTRKYGMSIEEQVALTITTHTYSNPAAPFDMHDATTNGLTSCHAVLALPPRALALQGKGSAPPTATASRDA